MIHNKFDEPNRCAHAPSEPNGIQSILACNWVYSQFNSNKQFRNRREEKNEEQIRISQVCDSNLEFLPSMLRLDNYV